MIQSWFRGVFRRLFLGGLVVGLVRVPFFSGLMLDFVYLAVGRRRRIDHSARTDFGGLHLEFLGFKNNRSLAVRRNAVHTRWGSSRGIDVARFIGSHRPDIGRGRRVEQLERRSQFQSAGTANGHARRGTLGEVLEFRLLPSPSAICEGG